MIKFFIYCNFEIYANILMKRNYCMNFHKKKFIWFEGMNLFSLVISCFSNHNMTTFYYWIPIGWSIILFLFIGATYNLSMHYIFKKQTLKQYVEKQNKFFMFECMLNENCKKKYQSTLIKTNMLKNKTSFLCFNACWMKNAKK
jgi:hypothetical protein